MILRPSFPSLVSREPVQFPESLRDIWTHENSVAAAKPGNLFPSRVGYHAAQQSSRLLPTLIGQTEIGYRPSPVEIVPVPKLDRTTRPAADMAPEDQIIYAGLASAIRERIHPGLVIYTGNAEDDQTYKQFETFPLDEPRAAYVIEADAAAFYQYVNHERLADELIGLTGWTDGVAPMIDLLEQWAGGPNGLPHGPAGSSVLADVYISPVGRTLARHGYSFRRHSDDFRIIATKWSEVRGAQLVLETAMRAVGLVLAPGKLRTPKIETYRRYLHKVDDERLQSAASRQAFEEMESDYAAPTVAKRQVNIAEARNAARVLREQLAPARVDVLGTRLIRRALSRLAGATSPLGLSELADLLRRYPHLTPWASSYVANLMGSKHEKRAVTETMAWATGSAFRYPWQLGWMMYALVGAKERHSVVAELASSLMYDPGVPWFVRGQASMATAIHGNLPPLSRYFDLFEPSPPATRPDLVAAAVIARPRWRSTFFDGVEGLSPILEAVTALRPDALEDWH